MTACISRELVFQVSDRLAEKDVETSEWFDLPGSHLRCFLRLDRGFHPDAGVCLVTGALRQGDNRAVQRFHHFAPSMEEMRVFLRNPDHAPGITESLMHLCCRADKGFE